MSNIFRDVHKFVPVVQRWQPGLKLSFFALNFHDCLCYLALTFSTERFENIPNSLFFDLRRMSPDAVERGREETVALRWIECEKGFRNTYSYWFLDADGREFIPKPETKARAQWRYQASRWQMHLANRRNHREQSLAGTSPVLGKHPELDRSVSGDARSSQPDFRETPEVDSNQNIGNRTIIPNCPPLEYLKTSNEVRSHATLGFQSKSLLEHCGSPTWEEVGCAQPQTVRLDGAIRADEKIDERSLFPKGLTVVTRKRTTKELLEHIQADENAIEIANAIARKFGARVVRVCDLE